MGRDLTIPIVEAVSRTCLRRILPRSTAANGLLIRSLRSTRHRRLTSDPTQMRLVLELDNEVVNALAAYRIFDDRSDTSNTFGCAMGGRGAIAQISYARTGA